MPLDQRALRETLAGAREALLAERNGAGYWSGELASSALSTATATFALQMVDRAACRIGFQPVREREAGFQPARQVAEKFDGQVENLSHDHASLVRRGLDWLVQTQRDDGGWGDTVASLSNISTTALCWATLAVASDSARYETTLAAARSWLAGAAGSLEPEQLAAAIARRYGKDRTFSVPILSVLALAGLLGSEENAWRLVPQLPFELAAFPRKWFRWLRLPVVSYALPALIALGQLRHHRRPTRNPAARLLRRLAGARSLNVLDAIQPAGGGFLEATPLTSFVVASLVGAGQSQSPVVRRGLEFLVASARPDGSWPIDTNLATWVTTLATVALVKGEPGEKGIANWKLQIGNCKLTEALPAGASAGASFGRVAIRDWLLGQQFRVRHPYTDAAPGGWSWTDLPGGVPDADDTPGALLALRALAPDEPQVRAAAIAAVGWLLDLQNRDGGIPTFCRGWGALPFDRSGADLTAHALLAWFAWRADLPESLQLRIDRAARRAVRYLTNVQLPDGTWTPLWFGNEAAPNEENRVYGVSRVLRLVRIAALRQIGGRQWIVAAQRATRWLLAAQNDDGGWGGAPATRSSIEETALALEALAEGARAERTQDLRLVEGDQRTAALAAGVAWLAERTDRGRRFPPTPIGFYFAKLWYFEKLYPLIYTVHALSAVEAAVALPIEPVRS